MGLKDAILLGYEVGSGAEVKIENTHILVTGLTNKSGKTTTIQALAQRSGRKVLVFATKPGEMVFEGEHIVPPFYEEKSDWQYVSAILEAVMKEKMRFERAWIIRATKGTQSLRDVDFNCKKFASGSKVGSLENNIFSNLHAYFEIVLPQLARVVFSETFPELEVGINVMDLTEMREEVQSLVIRACLDHISHDESGIVTVIPELWKFAPEGRGNPVKAMLEFLIRQGATRSNFVWMDSQDLAGVDKLPLKQVYTWLMGLQTERNEVQHTLDQLPLPRKSKPGADAIMTLDVGRFILATPKGVKTVYVMPSWMDELTAEAIAQGHILKLPEAPEPRVGESVEAHPIETPADAGLGKGGREQVASVPAPSEPVLSEKRGVEATPTPTLNLEEKKLVINLSHSETEVFLTTEERRGQVIFVLMEDADGQPRRPGEIMKMMAEHGWRAISPSAFSELASGMVNDGLLIKDDPAYRLPKFVKFEVKEPVPA